MAQKNGGTISLGSGETHDLSHFKLVVLGQRSGVFGRVWGTVAGEA